MDEDSPKTCKILMIGFNTVFLLGGLALIAVGVWVSIYYKSLVGVLSAGIEFQNAAYIIIAAGAVVTIIAFVGCIGAIKESKMLLTLFVNFLVSVLISEVTALILAFKFTSSVEIIIRKAAMSSILSYEKSKAVTVAWDYVQTTCCGFNNGTDYKNTPFDLATSTTQPWPSSCCKRMPGSEAYVNGTSCLQSATVESRHTFALTGCYPELLRVVSEYSVAVGAVTATALAVQLLDIICACCVITNINANKVGAV